MSSLTPVDGRARGLGSHLHQPDAWSLWRETAKPAPDRFARVLRE